MLIKIKPVRPRRTYTAGKVPALDDLKEGELFINHADKKTWVRNGNDEIVLTSYLPENADTLDKLSETDNKPMYNGKEIALVTPPTPSGWDNGSAYDPTVLWKTDDIIYNPDDNKSYIRLADATVLEPDFVPTKWEVTTDVTKYVKVINGSAYNPRFTGNTRLAYLDPEKSPDRTDENIIDIFNGLELPQFKMWANSATSFRAVKLWVESRLASNKPNTNVVRDTTPKKIRKDPNFDFLKSGDIIIRKGNSLKISGMIPLILPKTAYNVGGTLTYIITIDGVAKNFGNSGWTMGNDLSNTSLEIEYSRVVDDSIYTFTKDSVVSVQLVPVMYQDANTASTTTGVKMNIVKNGSDLGLPLESTAIGFNSLYMLIEEIIK